MRIVKLILLFSLFGLVLPFIWAVGVLSSNDFLMSLPKLALVSYFLYTIYKYRMED